MHAVAEPTLKALLSELPQPARTLALELLAGRLLDEESLVHLLNDRRDTLGELGQPGRLVQLLYRHSLLTGYQRESVLSGDWRNLLLGNYRLLEVIGCGGMGTVYKAEHCLLKRKVAIKVVQVEDEFHPALRQRFYAEMRALAELSHPHIVAAIDAGEVASAANRAWSVYLVLELVTAGDLERHIEQNGPCTVAQACAFIRQAAAGLHAAHDRHIIHRDLKPSNLLLTDDGQVKLVDFGLARHFGSRLTDPRALLGSVDYMPPEQSIDPSSIGKEADVYGLGATLFYLLTGEPPHPVERNTTAALRRLQEAPARRVSQLRPDVPADLDDLVARMLDRDPARRPCPPLLVAHALTAFVLPEVAVTPSQHGATVAARRVLVLAPDGNDLAPLLRLHGHEVHQAATADDAEALLRRLAYPLLVIQADPGLDVAETCRTLRARATEQLLKVLVVGPAEAAGTSADDVLPPADVPALLPFRCDGLLRLKQAEERAQLLTAQNQLTAHQLQESLRARADDVREAHNALLFAMAKMAESREGETPGHLRRLQLYCRALALEAASAPPWNALVDARFLELLDRCLPLHDIGKIGLPEDVLLKPGALTEAERRLIETHPVVGDRILEALGREHGASLEFLGTARALVRHHHERYDGTGYPDRLAGDAIPAVARLTAVADVYDALRRDRVHKRAMSHDDAVRVILNRSVGQFDPTLVQAFSRCHPCFEEVYDEYGD